MTFTPEVEFKVGVHSYLARRLSVFEQFHLASEFRDALIGLAVLKKDRPADLDDRSFIKAIEYILTGGSKNLTPEMRERVMHRCLSVVKRKIENPGVGWTDIQLADGTLMYQDIHLPEMIAIMYQVIDHNGLLDFFFEGPSSLADQEEKTGPHSKMVKTG